MAGVKGKATRVELTRDGREVDTYSMTNEQREAAGVAVSKPSAPPVPALDTYRMVDFVKAVAMRDDRGMEVRVNRVRQGAPVDRESPMKVISIVLNGTWFDITTQVHVVDTAAGHATVSTPWTYRVHVTNVVSAER